MEKITSTLVCERAEDLVAFLYNEVNEREAHDFELHLHNCAECTSALLEFRQLRESVVAWRNEALGVVPASAVASNTVAVSANFRSVQKEKASAIAAIREFCALSPLWLKAGVAFASLLFCIVALLAVSRLLEKRQPALVRSERLYTEKELKTKIEEGVELKLAELNSRQEEVRAPIMVQDKRPEGSSKNVIRRSSERASDSPQARRRPLTKSEREQLAADLRLTSPNEEDGLDLLDDRLNK